MASERRDHPISPPTLRVRREARKGSDAKAVSPAVRILDRSGPRGIRRASAPGLAIPSIRGCHTCRRRELV